MIWNKFRDAVKSLLTSAHPKAEATTGLRAFVSYPHEHKELVGKIVQLLKVFAREIFFDAEIELGEQWEPRILDKLRESPIFVVFWCKHSAESEWIHKEWEVALSQKKRIVPVLLDRTELPSRLSQFQWLEFLQCPEAKSKPNAVESIDGFSKRLFKSLVHEGFDNEIVDDSSMLGFFARDWWWLAMIAVLVIGWRYDSARKAQQIDAVREEADVVAGQLIELEIKASQHKATADVYKEKLRGLLDEIKPMP